MRQLDKNNKLVIIETNSQPYNIKCAITSPELLDGEGHVVKREQGQSPRPYIIRVQAYETDTFPSDFYSEPM